jgi:prepilin-type N-terminal cleavage/methylation domain-containing protein
MLSAARTRTARDEGGFTLVELVISIAILGVVMAALTAAMLVLLDSQGSAGTRLDESRDLQFAAAHFGDDVHGANSVAAGGTPRCGSDPAALVEFVGADFDDATPPVTATTVTTYVLRTVTGSDGVTSRELHRLRCSSAAATPAYPLTPPAGGGDITVAYRLSTGTSPVVACTPAPCGAGTTSVEVSFTEQSGELTYSLVGDRRTT